MRRLAMNAVEKFQSFIVLGSVFLGLVLGQIKVIEGYSNYFITPFLMIMLLGVFLQIPLSQLRTSFRNIKFTTVSLIVNFIWTPLLAWLLGYIFLNDTPAIWLGFIMLLVTPCTDWYLIFTGISKGNVALGTTVLPLNLILQLLLLPFYLYILGNSVIAINAMNLLYGIFVVLVTPIFIANLIRKMTILIKHNDWFEENIITKVGISQTIFLNLAIVAMFASQGSMLLNNPKILIKMLGPLLLFFTINFIIGQLISKLLKFNYEDTAAFNLTTLARNSPISLAIAVASFPEEPIIALALIIGPLIELPVLALISQILLKIRKKHLTSQEHQQH